MSPHREVVQEAVQGPAGLRAQQGAQLLQQEAHLVPRGQALVSAPQGEAPVPVGQWGREEQLRVGSGGPGDAPGGGQKAQKADPGPGCPHLTSFTHFLVFRL